MKDTVITNASLVKEMALSYKKEIAKEIRDMCVELEKSMHISNPSFIQDGKEALATINLLLEKFKMVEETQITILEGLAKQYLQDENK